MLGGQCGFSLLVDFVGSTAVLEKKAELSLRGTITTCFYYLNEAIVLAFAKNIMKSLLYV